MTATDRPWRCARCQRQTPYATRRGGSPVCNRCREELAAKGKRWCVGCHTALPLTRFARTGGKGNDRRRGRCYRCRQPAMTASIRRWRHRHAEARRAYSREYRARDPERTKRWSATSRRRRFIRLWKKTIGGPS